MKKKIKYPNIVRGGYAIPIYENMFLLKGKTHEEGGIDLGSTIEAENNEVLQINKNNIKVFSSVPFLDGNSPAELVLGGANPTDVFNAQEAFKDRHNLNDDGSIKARNGILKRIQNKLSNIYWHTFRAPKDYSDDKAILRNGKTTVECAKWANDALQGQGLSIFGDAWTRSSNKGIKKVYSGYNRKARPTEYDEAAVEQYVFDAADSLAKIMDLSKLQTNDIVGLYFRNSPNLETAYRKGTNGEAQTHTGNIVVEDGVPYVIHNVHGELIKNKAKDLIGSNHPYGIVSVYRKKLGGDKNLDSLINNVLSRPANFVQRLKDPNRKTIQDWEDTTKIATHKLGAEYINGVPVIYPNVQEIDGELIDFTRPPYDTWSGLDNAIEKGDTVQVKTLQDAIDFTENYKDYISSMKQYRNGGLSRRKDHDSSKKPYPNVKSSDFAGGNRSYPIPTKADAVDALRLAGLHGRSDVKAKVYKKYPELRKRKPLGGGAYYDATFPSTGGSQIATTAPSAFTAAGTSNAAEQISRGFGLPIITNPIEIPGNVIDWQYDVNTGLSRNTPSRVPEYTSRRADYTNLILNSIGSLANIGGNLASYFVNRNMLNDLEYSPVPIPIIPAKLKTRININPQLQRLYTDLGLMTDAVNNNTTSSRTALARNQRLRNQTRQAINELYGNKENIETQLINRDRLNQQQVALNNILQYNRWRQGLADFNNELANLRAENKVATTQGIVRAITDFLSALRQNNLEARTLSYLQQSNPYAIDALSPNVMRALNIGNGYIRLGKCGGKFKSKKK